MSGHATAATPTAPTAPVARKRKSLRVGGSIVVALANSPPNKLRERGWPKTTPHPVAAFHCLIGPPMTSAGRSRRAIGRPRDDRAGFSHRLFWMSIAAKVAAGRHLSARREALSFVAGRR